MKILVAVKGGPGSGNWGHTGRPGLVGGSGGGAGGSSRILSELNVGARYTYVDGIPVLRINQDVVSDISKDSGVDEQQVHNMADEWLALAAENYLSLVTQQDAGDLFGVSVPAYISDKVDAAKYTSSQLASRGLSRRASIEVDEGGTTSQSRRSVLRAIYNNTQQQLIGLGFKPTDTVRLYRGVSGGLERERAPLESFTASRSIAELYARGEAQIVMGKGEGAVAVVDVPVKSIFSLYGTGFGDAASQEFVVVGDYAS